MDPVRWREIERQYHAALARPVEERAAYLAAACADDEGLRREVQALLDVPASAAAFLAAPAVAMAADIVSGPADSVLSGRRLGVYEVRERIGAGGMGEVYRARDTKLGRDVAIKILPRAFTADTDRLGRFEREARVLAALNHPNIATIHGFEDQDGVQALVMELVEGDTLARRLEQSTGRSEVRGTQGRGLPVDEALSIAKQIADALDAAHEKGIVHRDLKPANLKITPGGLVKVLDFGLAKVAMADGAESQAPTVTMGGTREGAILGTAAYMSPEQARGHRVDKRTDVWAFGCVLYEMLAGETAFARPTLTDTFAAVVNAEPDWSRLPGDVPPAARRLLERCLEKDPKRRLRDIGDAMIELSSAITFPTEEREPRKLAPRWIWGLASGLIVAGLALGWTIAYLRPPVADARTIRLIVNPPAGTEFGVDTGAAISPDGRILAFVTASAGSTKLWVRPLNSLAARELPGTDAATFPFWSPNGRSLGFFAAGKLKRIEVAGGLPTVICDVGLGRGGTWNEEGVILFNAVNDGPLLRVSASGGTPIPVTTIDRAQGENSHRWPQFLPGGRRFLYFARASQTADAENSGVYVGSLDQPEERIRLLSSSTNAIYAPDQGQLLWVRDGRLMAQTFDAQRGQTTGESVVVAEGVAFGSASRLAAVSASNDGTLLYGGAGIPHVQAAWYDREGKRTGEVGQPDEYGGLRISPDGRHVASTRSGDVWLMEFARGIPSRVTFGGGVGVNPLWAPDGQRIAYVKGAPPNLFSRRMNGDGAEARLVEAHDTLATEDWSPDGKFLLYHANSNDLSLKTQSDLWVLPLTSDAKPAPFLSTPFREGRGQFSPDTRWVAYTSDESGGNEVYVQSFPAGGSKWRVSSKGGDWVRWRRDGREIFYVAPDRKLMSVATQTVSGALEFGTPHPVFTIPLVEVTSGAGDAPYTYDVAPDGQRFLALAPVAEVESPPLTVILNWQVELSTATK